MKFEIKEAKNHQFYFVLKARNGQVIATSEMYKSKQSCRKGIRSCRISAPFAKVVDLTEEE